MSVFLTLVSGFQTLSFVVLFWYDLIPTIGYASTMSELFSNQWQSLKWTWMGDGAGIDCLLGCWIFVLMYCMTSYGQSILLRYTEGAIYSSMVAAMVTPIGEVFWMLFNSATDFKWDPTWTSTSWFPLLGLIIIVPCVFIYNVYGEKKLCPSSNRQRLSKKEKLLIQQQNQKIGYKDQSNSPLIYNPSHINDVMNDANSSYNHMPYSPRSSFKSSGSLSTPKR